MATPLTEKDLTRVYIRVQDEETGRWVSINCAEATDRQFHMWAMSRAPIQDGDDNEIWGLQDRAEFCDMLWQNNALVMLKEGAFDDDRT